MLLIIVKHLCGHIAFHRVDAKNDLEAAIIEAKLSRCNCPKCEAK